MKVIKVFVFVFTALILMVGSGAEERVVVADGEASGTGLKAKEKSLENALRNAVEKGFGVYIDSVTITENASVIIDEIAAETRGFVRSYDVLEEREQGDLYITKVRAVISMDKIWESDSLNLLLKRMGAPRFIILSSEDINGDVPKGYPAQQKMTEVLVNRGFQLIDAVKTEELTADQRDIIIGDLKRALELAKQVNAEIIVLLEAKVTFEKRSELYGKEMIYFNSICEARVIQADSGEIVSAAAGKAIRGAENPEEAIHDALSFSSLEASEDLIKGTLSAWAKYLNMGRPIELIIRNISASRLSSLIKALKSLEGVSSVSERKYASRTAYLEIKSKHKSLYLAESIENIPGFRIEVTDFSEAKIQLKIL
jgi:hypothetical protein